LRGLGLRRCPDAAPFLEAACLIALLAWSLVQPVADTSASSMAPFSTRPALAYSRAYLFVMSRREAIVNS
jgi:hypothetical protein